MTPKAKTTSTNHTPKTAAKPRSKAKKKAGIPSGEKRKERHREQQEQRLEQFEDIIDYTFEDIGFLSQALTHSSVKDENHPCNETLEFLGDAILGFVISDYVFRNLPEASEGDLTRIKSVVVSRASLGKLAKKLNTSAYLEVGKGIRKRRSLPSSIASNAIEALIAALYLDGGLAVAREFILEHFSPMVRTVTKNRHAKNYKSLLQHLAQRRFAITPEYPLLEASGPDHLKVFEVAALVGKRQFPSAQGRTKKAAEQRAARLALKILREEHGKDA